MSSFIDDISINTIVGPGAFIKGNLNISGLMRIDGDIEGDIFSDSKIIIGEKARIKGNICANSVVIGGLVNGDIIAPSSIEILSSGMLVGDAITKKIRIDYNVVFNGFCFAVDNHEEFEKTKINYANKRGLSFSGLNNSNLNNSK